MKRTLAKNSLLLTAPPERVFDVLAGIERYSLWWPPSWRLQVISPPPHGVGSILEVRTLGSRFRCRLLTADRPRQISVEYVTGPHRGRGSWILEPRNGGTQVTYVVDLIPHGFVASALSHVLNFSALHSRQMRNVLRGLAHAVSVPDAE